MKCDFFDWNSLQTVYMSQKENPLNMPPGSSSPITASCTPKHSTYPYTPHPIGLLDQVLNFCNGG